MYVKIGSPKFEPVLSKTMAYIKEKEIIIVDTDNWLQLTTLRNKNVSD